MYKTYYSTKWKGKNTPVLLLPRQKYETELEEAARKARADVSAFTPVRFICGGQLGMVKNTTPIEATTGTMEEPPAFGTLVRLHYHHKLSVNPRFVALQSCPADEPEGEPEGPVVIVRKLSQRFGGPSLHIPLDHVELIRDSRGQRETGSSEPLQLTDEERTRLRVVLEEEATDASDSESSQDDSSEDDEEKSENGEAGEAEEMLRAEDVASMLSLTGTDDCDELSAALSRLTNTELKMFARFLHRRGGKNKQELIKRITTYQEADLPPLSDLAVLGKPKLEPRKCRKWLVDGAPKTRSRKQQTAAGDTRHGCNPKGNAVGLDLDVDGYTLCGLVAMEAKVNRDRGRPKMAQVETDLRETLETLSKVKADRAREGERLERVRRDLKAAREENAQLGRELGGLRKRQRDDEDPERAKARPKSKALVKAEAVAQEARENTRKTQDTCDDTIRKLKEETDEATRKLKEEKDIEIGRLSSQKRALEDEASRLKSSAETQKGLLKSSEDLLKRCTDAETSLAQVNAKVQVADSESQVLKSKLAAVEERAKKLEQLGKEAVQYGQTLAQRANQSTQLPAMMGQMPAMNPMGMGYQQAMLGNMFGMGFPGMFGSGFTGSPREMSASMDATSKLSELSGSLSALGQISRA